MIFPATSSVVSAARRRWGTADRDVSMTTRVEVTEKYVKTYVTATKKQKGAIMDTVVGITDWVGTTPASSCTAAPPRR